MKRVKAGYLQLIDAKEIIEPYFLLEKDYFRHHVDSVCLSYYLDERYQRNGYMYESLKIVIDKLFEQGIEAIVLEYLKIISGFKSY
ncbi:MAG: hypothetical protein ACLTAI_01125 [Thomasclavelia sp.]